MALVVGGEAAKASLDWTATEGVSHIGDGSEGMDVITVMTETTVNSAISFGGAKANSMAADAFGDRALKSAESNLTAARKSSTKADNVARNRNPGSSRGYDGPSSVQGRLQYNAAARELHSIINGRSFGLHNELIRHTQEVILSRTVGVLALPSN